MAFELCTFGALELRTAGGDPVPGAAGQPKPLLILALAALTPGGIPRDRLLKALWPGIERERARATLKQHLYALRRATGEPDLVSGSPRLRVNHKMLRVDALDFAAHVDGGRLREAAALLRGDLLEGVLSGPDVRPELAALVAEIQREFAAKVTLVREAEAVRRSTIAVANRVEVPLAVRAAEREVVSATQRFVRGMVTLPLDALAAYHRAVWCSHDLLEALRGAELASVAAGRIAEMVEPARALWLRSDLVRRMEHAAPGERVDVETREWLLQGGVRTTDAVGSALERHLLEDAFAGQLRDRTRWETSQVIDASVPPAAPRILAIGGGAAALADALPLLERSATVVINEAGDDVLALAAIRLGALDRRLVSIEGDPFRRIAELEAAGPFDLILTGTMFDRLNARAATWLVTRLLHLLAPEGELLLTSLVTDESFSPWLRHIVGWDLVERDQDDLLLLLGEAAAQWEMVWEENAARTVWRVRLHARVAERARSAPERT
ncbi:MAG TPA: hypothetical protein VHW65_06920 [Gemmatimonadales bacterium]|jgi:hypothetical protein|nr:hypothetical protein [Gemmatimonadales bacterium]